MNKRYIDELFAKNKSGKIIRYLQDNVWNLSNDDVQYIFDKSFYSNQYYLFYYILEIYTINRKVELDYDDKAYDSEGDHNDTYLYEHINLEINTYIINKDTKIKPWSINVVTNGQNLSLLKYHISTLNLHFNSYDTISWNNHIISDTIIELRQQVNLNNGSAKFKNFSNVKTKSINERCNNFKNTFKYIFSHKFFMKTHSLHNNTHYIHYINDIHNDYKMSINYLSSKISRHKPNQKSLYKEIYDFLISDEFLNLYDDLL